MPTDNVYVNEKYGYKLTFPKSWIGWFFIDDTNPEKIAVNFYGKSIAGTILYMNSEDGKYGQNLFYIMSETELNNGTYDNVSKIGSSRCTNYYYATGTGATMAMLSHNYDSWADYEGEPERMKKDWEYYIENMDGYDVENSFELLP